MSQGDSCWNLLATSLGESGSAEGAAGALGEAVNSRIKLADNELSVQLKTEFGDRG